MIRTLIRYFTEDHVGANILMIVFLLAGFWGITKINTQFLPDFDLDIISVNVIWPGASAEDVERSITIPLEQELKSVNNIAEITSSSRESVSSLTIELVEGSDMSQALDEVKEQIDLVRNLPKDAEFPEVSKVTQFERVAQVLLFGPDNINELKRLAHQAKRDLLQRGIAEIDMVGLPEEEIAIEVSTDTLFELGHSLPQIATELQSLAGSVPAGNAGEADFGYQLRSPERLRNTDNYNDISLNISGDDSIKLNEIATISQRPQKNEVQVFRGNQRAIELVLKRPKGADALESARILNEWVEDYNQSKPPTVQIEVYEQTWKLLKGRLNILIKNGLGGLALILLILFLTLEKRVAFWISLGIPVSFLAALSVLNFIGGTINMVSLFALIMTLGIIVDDTIVVGENAFARIQGSVPPKDAAFKGAMRMLVPVLASSLTTIAAFLPLMLLSGPIGRVFLDIPIVVICVIIASLLECFLILPGHLNHAFLKNKIDAANTTPVKRRFDVYFDHFKSKYFRNWVRISLTYPYAILVLVSLFMVLAFSLIFTKHLSFNFFPAIENKVINANIEFVSGMKKADVDDFMQHLRDALEVTRQEVKQIEGHDIIQNIVTYSNQTQSERGPRKGSNLASLKIDLTEVDHRNIRNQEFIALWRDKITFPPGLENFTLFSNRAGPPGIEIEVDLTGEDTRALKAASLEFQSTLAKYNGVFNILDDLPYGKPQLTFNLNTQGEALGLTVVSLGNQLRAAFDGQIVQIVNQAEDEVEVRVSLPDYERDNIATLEYFPVITPVGSIVPLSTIATWQLSQGLDTLKHTDGQLSIRISAEVDTDNHSSNDIISKLEATLLPELESKYGVQYKFKGLSEDQATTFSDMKTGAIIALSLIYLILAFIFSSYLWPLAVMIILPFGLTGAIFGHWLTGIDLTVLSLCGFFGLSGIVVNDSIILVSFYKDLKQRGLSTKNALIESSCQRLRAVFLTSLTTIAGLTPLMFETSLQAQFLIPMATSITFGLAFATILVLLVVPSILLIFDRFQAKPSSKA